MCPWVFVFIQQFIERRRDRKGLVFAIPNHNVHPDGHPHGHHSVNDPLHLVETDQLEPGQLLHRLAVHRAAMLDELECVVDGVALDAVASWCYPAGILKEICQYTLRWYTRRDEVGDIRICRGELYLFAFTLPLRAAESVEFALCEENHGDERVREAMQHRVAVFNWGLRYNDSVCINERASSKEWKAGDAVHLKVDTRCRGGVLLQIWITTNGVCSRGICMEIDSGQRALSLAVDGGFALEMGVKLC